MWLPAQSLLLFTYLFLTPSVLDSSNVIFSGKMSFTSHCHLRLFVIIYHCILHFSSIWHSFLCVIIFMKLYLFKYICNFLMPSPSVEYKSTRMALFSWQAFLVFCKYLMHRGFSSRQNCMKAVMAQRGAEREFGELRQHSSFLMGRGGYRGEDGICGDW